jgi:hypothetical protein
VILVPRDGRLDGLELILGRLGKHDCAVAVAARLDTPAVQPAQDIAAFKRAAFFK